MPRPQGAACDVGAIELEADAPPTTSTPTTSTTPTTPGVGSAPSATPVVGAARFTE